MLKWRPRLRLAQVKMVRRTECVSSCTTHCISSDDWKLELCLARFESLMDRRPLLLSSVLLRQNPHNVHEWHKRVALFENNPREVLLVCSCFLSTIPLFFSPDYQCLHRGSTNCRHFTSYWQATIAMGQLC